MIPSGASMKTWFDNPFPVTTHTPGRTETSVSPWRLLFAT
jgi:hypothetical protein